MQLKTPSVMSACVLMTIFYFDNDGQRKTSRAKSRKDQGVSKAKYKKKTRQIEKTGLNNWSISKSQNGNGTR